MKYIRKFDTYSEYSSWRSSAGTNVYVSVSQIGGPVGDPHAVTIEYFRIYTGAVVKGGETNK